MKTNYISKKFVSATIEPPQFLTSGASGVSDQTQTIGDEIGPAIGETYFVTIEGLSYVFLAVKL